MRPRNCVNSEGVSDTIRKSPGSGEASKHNKNVRTTISAGGLGNIRVTGEESYSESRNNSTGVSGKPFFCVKEGWGTPTGNKSKKLNTFIPYEHFKMEGLHCLKFLLEKKQSPVQIDLKDAYFAIPLSKQSPKYVRLFWFKTSSKSFYQITKNPNYSFETNEHLNNCLSGQYVVDGEDLTGNYDNEGYIYFSVAKVGVCDKSEKVNPTTSDATRISRFTDKYRGNGIGFLSRKTNSCNSTMSGGLLSNQNFSV